ncbi:hypothetical protein ABTN34_18710, partial [Acinetobacter baumannii]
IPVSLRFSTAEELSFYSLLALRLAELLKERLSAPPDATALQFYRDWSADLLGRLGSCDQPIVLVLDGLDEAVGWEPGRDL